MISHGCAQFMLDRLLTNSDEHLVHVCVACGLVEDSLKCRSCLCPTRPREMRMPYACKLLFDELRAMHIMPRMRLS
jgi:DNA-directed RNA polymerase beta subunit